MPDLSVPLPILKFQPLASGLATFEKPIEVQCSAVTFPDGTVFDQSKLGTAGFFTYRQQAAGGAFQIWDEDSKEWKPDADAPPPNLKPKPFAFQKDKPMPWQGYWVAVGQKDKNDRDQFEEAVNGFPQYFTRAFFTSTSAGGAISGLSAPSLAVQFISVLDTMLAGIEVGDGEKPADASLVRLFLRFPEKRNVGWIELKRTGSVEIANFNPSGTAKAVIRLLPSGDILLEPAPGRQVIVSAQLETEKIFYRPAAGGAKQLLI